MRRIAFSVICLFLISLLASCSQPVGTDPNDKSSISDETYDVSPVSPDGPDSSDGASPTIQGGTFLFGIPDWFSFGMKEGEVRKHMGEVSEYKDLIYNSDGEYKEDYDYTTYCGFTSNNESTYFNYTVKPNLLFDEDDSKLDMVKEYNEIKNKMTVLLGAPYNEEEQWLNDRYKDDPDMMYKAVKEGHYTIKSSWQKDNYFASIWLKENEIVINYALDKNNT